MSDNHSEKAAQIRNAATARIREIQADSGLSAEGKGRQIREAREQANKKITALRAAHQSEQATKRESLVSQLFALGHRMGATETEKILATQSFRDALFKASEIESAPDALRVLQRSGRTGDAILARAIATIAYEKDWHSVVNAYANDSEDAAAALEELRALESKSNGQKFQENMAFSVIPEAHEERVARATEHSGSARHGAPSAA